MKRLLSLLLVLVLATVGLSAMAAEDTSNTLVVFLPEDPETLDVQLTTDSYAVPLNCYDRLVECETVDGQAMLVPGLADLPEITNEGMTYTFKLREGVVFHNGEPFTADDVIYTVNRMMNPETLAKNTDIYSVIVGAMDYYNGNADSVSGVVALDDYTVQFNLTAAYAPFLACLATPGGSIYNREACEAAGANYGKEASSVVGTGPFVVDSWVLGDEVTLSANENYFKGAPSLDGIIFDIVPDPNTQRMLFETGKADVFNFDYADSQLQWFRDNGYADQIISGTRAGTYYFMFNTSLEPLNDVRVRKAVQMAVDRQSILDALYSGEGQVIDTFIPAGILSHNENAPAIAFDPEGAKQLLKEAGYENGFDMEISLMADSANALLVSQVMQSYLAQVGIRVTIKQYDESTYYAVRKDGQLPSYYNSWSADFNDPDNFLYTFFSEKNNVGRSVNYTNTDIMKALDDARVMTDETERLAVYQDIDNAVVHEDAVVFPLFQRNHLFCVNPRVQGFAVPWNGWSDMSFYNISIVNG